MSLNRDITIRYLGHSTFLITTPARKTLLLEAWVKNNPACPEDAKTLEGLDTLLISHGHFDHLQDAVELAKEFKPQIGCNFEISIWLGSQGVENVNPMNKGGSQKLNDVRVTMVNAHHSGGILEGDNTIVYGGEPGGYVVEFENRFKLYFAGDTCVFGDMKIIADLYEPELVFLPIGDLFTMGPREAAYACRLLGARKVIPMHYGTFPVLTGTPEELANLTRDLGTQVLALRPGETLS